MSTHSSRIRRIAIVLLTAVVVGGLGFAVRLWISWGQIHREDFDPTDARSALESPDNTNLGSPTTAAYIEDALDSEPLEPLVGGPLAQEPGEYGVAGRHAQDDGIEVYLILGSDQRPELGESRRADVILLLVRPRDGSRTVLISIPRDLYIPNPCTGEETRVNANLNGCGSYASGPEQMAVAVENFAGVGVDHFVVVTFDGFRRIVDRVGGVRICTDVAVRDWRTDPEPLDLPSGCTTTGGYQALAWMRSRRTEGLVDGQWVRIPGGDLVRNQRQQDVIVQALERLASMKDISELTALIEDIAPELTLDETLPLSDATSLVWGLRSINIAELARPVLPVADYVDPAGRYVLVPQATFESVVVAANPDLGQYFRLGD